MIMNDAFGSVTRVLMLLGALTALPVAQAVAREARPYLSAADILARSKPEEWRPLDPENTLYVDLEAGRVIIQLAPDFAPRHVANIKALARFGFYDGLGIGRVQDNYVVQWNAPDETRPVGPAQKTLKAEFSAPMPRGLSVAELPDGDLFAAHVGVASGLPMAWDKDRRQMWLAHCYGMVGAGRDNDPDSGGGAELYAVIGHAPRQLDRNVTLVGRVVQGIALLSALPRGSGAMGFYEPGQTPTPILRVRVEADVPEAERTPLEILRETAPSFAAVTEARRNRRDPWTVRPAGHIDLCNVPLPVRPRRQP